MRVELIARGSIPALATLCACSPSVPVKSEVDPVVADASATASPQASVLVAASVAGPPLATSPAKPLSTVVKPVDRVKEALAALDDRVVDDKHIGRRVLYTWTPRQQADAIQAGGRVLTLVESKNYGPSGFDFMLDDEVVRGNALARLLLNTGFAKKRFAWPNAYATALGTTGGRYGTSLLMVELAKDALILDFANKKVFDVENKEVPLTDLTAHPERLGAVYWSSTAGYREYVLVNEAAIARVSTTTEETEKAREAEKAVLAQVTAGLRQLLIGDEKELLERFSKTLAFAATSTRETVDRIATDSNTFTPDKLRFEVQPKVKFDLGTSRGRIKPPTCKLEGTRGRFKHDYSFGGGQYCTPGDRCQNIAGKCQAIRRPLWFNDTQRP
jgi:hypothetical protein